MDAWLTEKDDFETRPALGNPEGTGGAATLTKEEEPTQEAEPPQEQGDRLEALLTAVDRQTAISPAKAATLRSILKNVRDAVDNAIRLLEDGSTEIGLPVSNGPVKSEEDVVHTAETGLEDGRVIEGVFDGQGMVGDDGKAYAIPPNYASKSKLVEGDMLKLTIGSRGNFIYKQIGPIDRQRLIGTVTYEQDSGQHLVLAGGRSWRVLKASITYFKAEISDEAVILVPKNAPSKWAAVENVIKRPPQQS